MAERHPNCDCPRTAHRHGSRTTYVIHGCDCRPCMDANRDAERARNRAKLYGRYNRFVPGDTVRAHMRSLMAQGMGWKPIADAAGVAQSTTYAILYGKHLDKPDHPEHRPPRIKVDRRVAEKLMAVELQLQPGAKVPGVGTTRRLQALVTLGWSASELARRIGMAPTNFSPLLHGRRDTLKGTADAVAALYDLLWDQEPPASTSTRARRFAARQGWVPPLAWDDDTINDPNATPDLGDELSARRWHVEDAQWLLDAGTAPEQIAVRLGASVDAIGRAFRRAGLDGAPFEAARKAQNRRTAA